MRKKLISLILGVILCSSVFAGCALIEHNNEKDMQQVVAVIDPITDTSGDKTFTSKPRYIYKSDLNSAMLSYAQSYMSNYGLTLQQTADRLLEELITRELLFVEAERLESFGEIVWTKKDDNDKKKYIYNTVDNQLNTIRNEILSDYDESAAGSGEEESASTTYPTPDAEESDEDYEYYEFDERGNIVYEKNEDGTDKTDKDGNKIPVIKDWAPALADYPCLWGDEDRKSLDREAIQRFVALLRELTEADFKVTADDRAKFKEDDKKIDDTVNSKGWAYVYPMLGETHYLEYLVGRSARQSLLITKLQDYITDGVTVTDEEVVDAYTKQRKTQLESYADNQSAYQTAFTGGNTTMLYFRDDSCFYVKHILLPFSDEQTAALTAYKANPANAGKDYTVMRDTQMVNETVVYPHVNGENDTENPKSVQDVFHEIYGAMARVKNNPKEAERLFDSFTYKYNTDPGAFGVGKQYAIKRNDPNNSGYMKEFYDGAIQLYDEHKVGEVLPEIVVTDYGVHIMYFAQDVVPGYVRSLNDYLTPGAYKTVRETFRETIQSTKENNAFNAWSEERITYYQKNQEKVHTYPKRYKSLYEA